MTFNSSSLAQPIELRFMDGPRGYFRLYIHGPAEAMKTLVALRHIGLGLSWSPCTTIMTTSALNLDSAERVLIQVGLARKRY